MKKVNIQDLCVDRSASLQFAMKQMDKAARKIIFVLSDGRLLASLSDGDIRRFLLDGHDIHENVMQCANTKCKKASSVREARELLQKHRISCVPVIDENEMIAEVIFRDESIRKPAEALSLPVVIMAGGKGARLEPYTKVLPKPLIPVGEVPIIEHIINAFVAYGCLDFHMIVNHKRQLIKAYFAEEDHPYNVYYYDEEKPLGTGGGLYLLKEKINSTFILSNCDILIDADYADIVRFHKEKGNVITMVCAYRNLTVPYGVIEMGKDGLISNMQEKPEFTFLTNTGIYIVEPEVIRDIIPDQPIGFPDIMKEQMAKGRKVAVYPINEGDWMDMGQLPELEKMREQLNGAKR